MKFDYQVKVNRVVGDQFCVSRFHTFNMQLLKPVWVSADGQAFMSIDIHPDGIRFATGGQGEDCGRVSIWNVKPILDEKAARDKDVPKLLTQMDHHLGCVNCVRWSNSGKFLASGGDDKLVRWIL